MTKIFIGGFPLEATELELVQLVSWHGNVSTIKIVRDKKTRVCKGYAFIEMNERSEAETAVEALSGTTFGGRELLLNIVEEAPVKPPVRPRSYQPVRPTASRPASDKPKRPRRAI